MYSHDYARLYHRGFMRLESDAYRRKRRLAVELILTTVFFIAALCFVAWL